MTFPDGVLTLSHLIEGWRESVNIEKNEVFHYEVFNFTAWTYYVAFQNIELRLRHIDRLLSELASVCAVELAGALNRDPIHRDQATQELIFRNLMQSMTETFCAYDRAFNIGKARSFDERRWDFIEPVATTFIERYVIRKIHQERIKSDSSLLQILIGQFFVDTMNLMQKQ